MHFASDDTADDLFDENNDNIQKYLVKFNVQLKVNLV